MSRAVADELHVRARLTAEGWETRQIQAYDGEAEAWEWIPPLCHPLVPRWGDFTEVGPWDEPPDIPDVVWNYAAGLDFSG